MFKKHKMGLQSENHITVLVASPCSNCLERLIVLDTSLIKLLRKSASHHPYVSLVPAFFSLVVRRGMVLGDRITICSLMPGHKNLHLPAYIGSM
jgi:hypothetical protein